MSTTGLPFDLDAAISRMTAAVGGGCCSCAATAAEESADRFLPLRFSHQTSWSLTLARRASSACCTCNGMRAGEGDGHWGRGSTTAKRGRPRLLYQQVVETPAWVQTKDLCGGAAAASVNVQYKHAALLPRPFEREKSPTFRQHKNASFMPLGTPFKDFITNVHDGMRPGCCGWHEGQVEDGHEGRWWGQGTGHRGYGCRAGVVVGSTEKSVGPTSKKAQKYCKAAKATIKCKSD